MSQTSTVLIYSHRISQFLIPKTTKDNAETRWKSLREKPPRVGLARRIRGDRPVDSLRAWRRRGADRSGAAARPVYFAAFVGNQHAWSFTEPDVRKEYE